jgi:hypothetical protein
MPLKIGFECVKYFSMMGITSDRLSLEMLNERVPCPQEKTITAAACQTNRSTRR